MYKLIFGVQENRNDKWQFIGPTFKTKMGANDYIADRNDADHPYDLRVARIWRQE